jgi:hypothetical protein
VIWRAAAIDPKFCGSETFHFTVEEIMVDRLVEQPQAQQR